METTGQVSHTGTSDYPHYQGHSQGNGVGILKTSAVSSGKFKPKENRAIAPDDLGKINPLHTVRPGDLLLNRLNSPGYVGAMACVLSPSEGLVFSDKIWRLELGQEVDPEYLALWSLTPAYRKQVDFTIVGTSQSMQSLGYGTFQRFRITLPPLEKQCQIVDEISAVTAEIDAMLADITELRDLLAERRAAVIAAAVTGQIDIPAAEETTHD